MTEQLHYDLVRRLDGFEVRRYPDYVVVEMDVSGSFESAGNRAFRALAGYISGRNRSQRSIAMTSPVLQHDASKGESIAMTAPVLQQGSSSGSTVAFVLPASVDQDAVPVPLDSAVRTRHVTGHLAAARRYSGRWSEGSYRQHETQLLSAIAAAGLTPAGPTVWARYDPPWTPWFLRRNEVIIPVEE